MRTLAAPAAAAAAAAWMRARLDAASALWRRSLQLRVVTSTFALSAVVLLVLGLVLQAQITNGLLEAQTKAALEQARNSQRIVEGELAGVDPATDELTGRLTNARNRLASRPQDDSGDSSAAEAGLFTSVLIDGGARRTSDFADPPYSGPINEVPVELRVPVQQGKLAHKIATLQRKDGQVTVIAVGIPVTSAGRQLQLYLMFPLSAHQQTLALVQNTLLAGGALLTLLLAGIAGLVTRQVVQPVRQAAEVSERFASGHLDERMPVTGEDDVARLAVSFNGMAGSIQHQIHQLEEFGALQRRFTSDVSHELRTPLTTVRMAADVLHAARHEFPPGLRRSTELMVDELDRFEVLLVDLLEISRLDAGVADLALEQVDVRSLVRGAVESISGVAAPSNSSIELVVPDEELEVEVDPRRFGRILRNLLVNALDHGEGRPVRVRLAGDCDAIAVVVRDHGIGLAKGEEELVFNRFWRADPSRNRRTGGTGLGLAISLEDARLHGGWLQAWGRPGEGAVFRLTLPRRHGATLRGSPLPLRPDEPSRATATVLPAAGNAAATDGRPPVGPAIPVPGEAR
ncbi:MAG TPA: MtrAB system histidine kinase MtrB [Pseudonocardiaceae bacterium]|nr:MtrAB system histidine kinase MtrB [Pseudonocardiaceae bacterium]